MERKRFGVTYFLRKARTNKAGLTPILARITTNGVSKEIYIQCSVPADKWNQSKERATGKDKLCQQVNSYLDDYRARILAVRQELIALAESHHAFDYVSCRIGKILQETTGRGRRADYSTNSKQIS